MDGILIYMVPGCEDELRKLVESRKPVVLLGRAPATFQADLVGMDHFTGTRMAVEYLLSRGHTRVGIIPGPEYRPFTRSRVEGWRAALKGAGIQAVDRNISYGDYTVEGGQTAMARLVALPDRPTAVLGGNFHEVVGILRVLRQFNLRRPDDIEVMASHDSDVLDAFDPPVSSVEQPVHQIGTRATELLLRRIRQPARPVEQVLLEPRLKIRTGGEQRRGRASG